ncbi:polysaccharide deacetylase family protein [Brucella haematophila]|uniref:Polysaccharide deacetylase n=1 Tax=Brucella haematophila TaxID=419474 RepID=A0ABX1DQD6_9HYPH|nr:polysaccharide deacetylase family protein [Brucella haematophila]NKC05158.1 polysaccharide deacetylase [Brucella haematophila]TMU95443.1 polysaccharide deacetylase [Brucella haematophila]
MGTDIWEPLNRELDRWHKAGKVADLWLRDDDAVFPTPALTQLLDLSACHSVPVALAVIPEHTGELLADYLADWPLATVVVHGWSHTNFAGEHEKKQELGEHRPIDVVAAELKSGLNRLEVLHAGRFAPVLVPPWNRIAPSLVGVLAGLGFGALSVFGPEKLGPLPMINTHVDLMDWHGTRGARDHVALIDDIVRRLRVMFDGGGSMGFLTHHLVHDESAWQFLDVFFEQTASHPGNRWVALPDMLAQT